MMFGFLASENIPAIVSVPLRGNVNNDISINGTMALPVLMFPSPYGEM